MGSGAPSVMTTLDLLKPMLHVVSWDPLEPSLTLMQELWGNQLIAYIRTDSQDTFLRKDKCIG